MKEDDLQVEHANQEQMAARIFQSLEEGDQYAVILTPEHLQAVVEALAVAEGSIREQRMTEAEPNLKTWMELRAGLQRMLDETRPS